MVLWGVGVLYQHCQGEKRAVKEFYRSCVVGAATTLLGGGRAVQERNKQQWDFDVTRGFPGEDIESNL